MNHTTEARLARNLSSTRVEASSWPFQRLGEQISDRPSVSCCMDPLDTVFYLRQRLSPPLRFGQVQKAVLSAVTIDNSSASHRSVVPQQMLCESRPSHDTEAIARRKITSSQSSQRWRLKGRALPPVRTGTMVSPLSPSYQLALVPRAVSSVYTRASKRISISPCSAIELTSCHYIRPNHTTETKRKSKKNRNIWSQCNSKGCIDHLSAEPEPSSVRCSKGWWDVITSPFVAQHPAIDDRGRSFGSYDHMSIPELLAVAKKRSEARAPEVTYGTQTLPRSIEEEPQQEKPCSLQKEGRPILSIKIPAPEPDPFRDITVVEIKRKPLPTVASWLIQPGQTPRARELVAAEVPADLAAPAPLPRALRRHSSRLNLGLSDSPPAYAGADPARYYNLARKLEAGALPSCRYPASSRKITSSRTYAPQCPPLAPSMSVSHRLGGSAGKGGRSESGGGGRIMWCVGAFLAAVCGVCLVLALVLTRAPSKGAT